MTYSTLITVDALKAHLRDPAWRVFDCRGSASDPIAGEEHYRRGHIPGARHADLERTLSAPRGTDTGRHPLPERNTLAAWLGREGVDNHTQVVAYDDAGGAFAARLWWLLRWLGHPAAAVLDGGIQAWQADGGALESGEAGRPPAREFTLRSPLVHALDAASVADIVADRRPGRLLDARDPARYLGDEEPLDPVAGHIPGAHNRPFKGNLDEKGRFLTPTSLRERFEALGDRPEAIVHYCGSGVTACHNLLAMEHAGLAGSRLYPGSWSEWIRDPQRPLRRGPEPKNGASDTTP